jgi:hypothetical protein
MTENEVSETSETKNEKVEVTEIQKQKTDKTEIAEEKEEKTETFTFKQLPTFVKIGLFFLGISVFMSIGATFLVAVAVTSIVCLWFYVSETVEQIKEAFTLGLEKFIESPMVQMVIKKIPEEVREFCTSFFDKFPTFYFFIAVVLLLILFFYKNF